MGNQKSKTSKSKQPSNEPSSAPPSSPPPAEPVVVEVPSEELPTRERNPDPLPEPPKASAESDTGKTGKTDTASSNTLSPTKMPISPDKSKSASPTPREGRSRMGSVSAAGVALEPMPDEATLNKRFEDFMEEKCFKPEVRVNMRKMPPGAKWTILLQESSTSSSADEKSKVEHWIEVLKSDRISTQDMATLKIVLRGVGKSWMKDFADHDGLNLLISYLNRPGMPEGCTLEILRCIKAFINNDYGLSVLIQSPQGIEQLALAFVSADDLQRIEIVDLLAVVVWVSDHGHEMVIEALSSKEFKHPYKVLVQALHTDNAMVQTRVFTFINALINTHSILEFRVDMRRQFIEQGIMQAIEVVKTNIDKHRGVKWESVSQLATQCDLFEQMQSSDRKEVVRANLDLSDVDAVFEQLKLNAIEDGFSAELADVLHLLMCIPSDHDSGDELWSNVKFILGRAIAGSDPDQAAPTVISYNDLKEILTAKEKSRAAEKIAKTKELEKKIEEQRKSIYDYETKEATLKEAKDAVEKELNKYKTQIKELKEEVEKKDKEAKEAGKGKTDDKKIKELQAEIEKLKKELAEKPAVTAAAAPAAPPMGDVPCAPPMAPPMGDVPCAPPMAPPMGAPDAPPMAPPMGAPDAPPMAPPMAPAFGVPDAPGAPPMAPPMAPGAPGIPPPPGAPMAPAAPVAPKKANPKPAVPMKQFHWSVIPPLELDGTVWKAIDDSKVNFDKKQFESQFATAAKKPAGAPAPADPQAALAAAMRGGGGAAKREVIELVDPKRAYAINIALARFKMSHAAIRDALFAMDEKVLDEDKLTSLEKIAPTPEEIEAVKDFEGDEKDLGQSEQFFRTILPIPQPQMRIQLFLFRQRFATTAGEVEEQLKSCEAAIKSLKESKKLVQLLELILAMGNYLNGGSAKGGAWGFKLDTLMKLKNTKGADNQFTLLHFLIQQVQQKFPAIAAFADELKTIQEAMRVEYSALQTEINKIKGSVAKVKSQLDAVPKTPKDRFHAVMQEFYDSASKRSFDLSSRLEKLSNNVEETVKFFGESPSNVKMEELFNTFGQFVQDFREGVDYLEQKRVQAEKEAKSAAEAEKRKKENEEKKGKSPAPAPAATANTLQVPGAADNSKLVDATLATLNNTDQKSLMAAIAARRKQNAQSDAVKKASSAANFGTLRASVLQAALAKNPGMASAATAAVAANKK